MTQSIRDAAQALLNAIDSRLNDVVPYEQVAGLRAALSAPQHTDVTQSIRDAAQALLDAVDRQTKLNGWRVSRPDPGCEDDVWVPAETQTLLAADALRAAISAPQPSADERVAEHMALVCDYGNARANNVAQGGRFYYEAEKAAREAVAVSARALLSASQEDAKQQARLVELVLHMAEAKRLRDWEDLHIDLNEAISIAKAMSAKETK